MSNLVGHIIAGRYRVDEFLGRGGMADVYKVYDQQRAAVLAMKVLHDNLAEDKIFIRRFRREAQNLAKLKHPNIVRFYELGEEGELIFMMMEYVSGVTLSRARKRIGKPFTPTQMLGIMQPLCSALHYAHEIGLAHCDIKPGNIMIDETGRVLLTDFGIARVTEGAATATMVGAGTPAYMSPEQVSGADPTPQTDIYALGIVLFELITGGERPFTGEQASITGTIGEKIRWEKRKLDAPSPKQYNPEISDQIEEVVLRSLYKNRRKRYKKVSQLLDDLSLAVGADAEPLPRKIFIDETMKTLQVPKDELPGAPEKKEKSRRSLYMIMGIGGIGLVLCVVVGISLMGSMGIGIPGISASPGDGGSQAEAADPIYIEITSTVGATNTPSGPTATLPPSPTATTEPTATMEVCDLEVRKGRETKDGLFLEVCWDQGTYEIGPVAQGVIAVGPNKKFFVYVTSYADLFVAREGDEKLLFVKKLKKAFHYTAVNDVPDFTFEFHGDHPYKVTVHEKNEYQKETVSIPRYITTPND